MIETEKAGAFSMNIFAKSHEVTMITNLQIVRSGCANWQIARNIDIELLFCHLQLIAYKKFMIFQLRV